MSTIYTDRFAYEKADIEIAPPTLGHGEYELCISTEKHEVRLELTEEQLLEIVDQVKRQGIEVPAS
ncbi:hypothetical protein KZO83_07560 [Chromohalobacter sp. TMW 2.2308]|uniref:hypothetical protein n=1 Tax=Chromohalobacter TaxID=42054 RepID=UPI001FFCEC1C|nr:MULTISPECIES: hypothetical protein [Chromohalobacter]MCK2042544.1 hypothetical protein [Chromohalobacter moromii]MCT8514936.1 hypothetical protein [Chromohalobacter sp. TMW 2.2271]